MIVANPRPRPNLRIALVARRHVDLKRVCSCCCLP
ncbi:Ms4527A family Cys-rich leader peptide [Mycobacterium haemophilum]